MARRTTNLFVNAANLSTPVPVTSNDPDATNDGFLSIQHLVDISGLLTFVLFHDGVGSLPATFEMVVQGRLDGSSWFDIATIDQTTGVIVPQNNRGVWVQKIDLPRNIRIFSFASTSGAHQAEIFVTE